MTQIDYKMAPPPDPGALKETGSFRKRTAARGWLTRAKKHLLEMMKTDPVDEFALLDATAEFDKRLQSLDEAQRDFDMEVASTEMEAEIEAAYEYREEARKCRYRAA